MSKVPKSIMNIAESYWQRLAGLKKSVDSTATLLGKTAQTAQHTNVAQGERKAADTAGQFQQDTSETVKKVHAELKHTNAIDRAAEMLAKANQSPVQPSVSEPSVTLPHCKLDAIELTTDPSVTLLQSKLDAIELQFAKQLEETLRKKSKRAAMEALRGEQEAGAVGMKAEAEKAAAKQQQEKSGRTRVVKNGKVMYVDAAAMETESKREKIKKKDRPTE